LQRTIEKEMEEYTKQFIPTFKKLSNSSKWLDNNGKIVKDKNKSAKGTKSLDFEFIYNEITYYINSKYSEGIFCGGNQENAINEIEAFINVALKNNDDNIKFIALLDGGIYFPKHEQKLEKLINNNNYDKVCIMTHDNLIERFSI